MHMPMTQFFAYWTSCWLTRAAVLVCVILEALSQFAPGESVTGAVVVSLNSSLTQEDA